MYNTNQTKMKRVALGFSILIATGLFILMSCKKEADTVPEQDTEVKSAVLASYMNYVVSDIDMMISFMGENRYNDHFYAEYPNSALPDLTGTVTAIRDTTSASTQGWLRMSFNKTLCKDGRRRNGSVSLNYTISPTDPNAKYMRSPDFMGNVQFSAFEIDSFNVNLNTQDGGYMRIKNVTPKGFDPKKTNLEWTIEGKLKFTHLYDTLKNMTWEGKWTKVLANTSSTAAVVNATTAINWYNAVVKYTGTTRGKVPVEDENGKIKPLVKYEMKFNQEYPLTRDFKCAPDPIGGVTYTVGDNVNTGTMVPIQNQYHPFVSGIASFTVGESYPREIYYGNEGQKALLATPQCDNTGEVLIKGISYRVDFMR